jgi:endonuclease/exonuclease/phosphatase (EEP) superfamily protein YafD
MEHVSNEEKAMEFAKYHCANELNLIQTYNAALDTAQWKDEQYEQEKQQWIEKTCEWIKDNATYYAYWEWNGDTYEKEMVFDAECCAEAFIEAIKESMKGE